MWDGTEAAPTVQGSRRKPETSFRSIRTRSSKLTEKLIFLIVAPVGLRLELLPCPTCMSLGTSLLSPGCCQIPGFWRIWGLGV